MVSAEIQIITDHLFYGDRLEWVQKQKCLAQASWESEIKALVQRGQRTQALADYSLKKHLADLHEILLPALGFAKEDLIYKQGIASLQTSQLVSLVSSKIQQDSVFWAKVGQALQKKCLELQESLSNHPQIQTLAEIKYLESKGWQKWIPFLELDCSQNTKSIWFFTKVPAAQIMQLKKLKKKIEIEQTHRRQIWREIHKIVVSAIFSST